MVGHPPFVGATVVDTITKHLTEAIPPMDPALKVPNELKNIIFSAMEKNRDERYQSMDQVGNDLRNLAQGKQVEHRKLSTERKAEQKKRITIISFIAGFAIMYCLSIALQSLMDKAPWNPPQHKLETKHGHG